MINCAMIAFAFSMEIALTKVNFEPMILHLSVETLCKTSNGTQLSLLRSKSHTENSISFPLLWEPP